LSKHVESLHLDQVAVEPTAVGAVWRDGGDAVKIRDGVGVLNLRDAVAGDQVKVSADDSATGYLEDKIQAADSTIDITIANPGANEILQLAANITEVFRAQSLESATPVSTTITDPSWADAFAGSYIEIAPSGAGDYIAIVESDSRCTNANTDGQLALGLNGTTSPVAGSVRTFGGNKRGSTIVIKKLSGLVVGDRVHGIYNKMPGMGAAELYNRSMLLFRVGL
jgi:hypothetical protein